MNGVFWKNKKVLVTGGNGFLGGVLVKQLKKINAQVFSPASKELDLRINKNCRKAVSGQEIVIHLAAKVGGIGYNLNHAGEMFYDNIIMGAQLMEEARIAGVKKFVALGTICAYPKFTRVPFKEKDLWNGYPEETNAPYGLAKKFLMVQSQAYRQEYGVNAVHIIVVNLYGPGDNFDPQSSHVIPAMIRKIVEAKKENKPFVEAWGTGSASREFLYVDDAAEAIVMAAEKYDGSEPINIGSGREISIKELLTTICRLVDYNGEIRWDSSKPDGQPRRCLDVSRAEKEIGFKAKTSFEAGLKQAIDWYLSQNK